MTARATRDTGLTLRELLAFDEGGILRLLLAPSGQDVAITGMIIGEEGAARSYAGRIVLAVGVLPSVHDFVREAAGRGAAAVVLRDHPGLDPEDVPGEAGAPSVVAVAERAGVALLARAAWADWDDVATLVRSAAAYAGAGRGDRMADVTAGGGLAALASAVAEFTGGSITIEDTAFRVLAYSAIGPEADELRRSTILGGRVPDWRVEELRRSGLLRTLWSSDEVIHRPADGSSPERLIIAIRSGREMLGSIWAAADAGRPFTEGAARALRRAAEVAVPYLVQHRLRESGARRREEHALRGLLGGRGDMSTHAWTLGLAPDLPCAVVIADPTDPANAVNPQPTAPATPTPPPPMTAAPPAGWSVASPLAPPAVAPGTPSDAAPPAVPPAAPPAVDPSVAPSAAPSSSAAPPAAMPAEPPVAPLTAAPAVTPAASAGAPRAGWSVAPAAVPSADPSVGAVGQREAGLERVMGLLAVQAASYRAGIRVLRDGGRVMALVPVRRGAERDVLALARELDTLAASLGGAGPVFVGAGPIVPSPLRAADSRADAELVVRVLRERAASAAQDPAAGGGPTGGGSAGGRSAGGARAGGARAGGGRAGGGPAGGGRAGGESAGRGWGAGEQRAAGEGPRVRRHASAAELGAALDVQRVLDAVWPVWERGSGPVYDLVRGDLAAGGELVRSLAAYLDASCDVGRAAKRLVLHPNTLRYRLRRVRDRYGVDLDDPDTRLMLTLAVRLATRPR
ncbi:helix-turn-helix domain-containing protein [Nonomuraea bangladeshensis]|uniref:PucR family transcriptional regulator n=1 Tax=Nonomuraea bangladeshensis TaxID=404385 RepID=UPI0031D8A7AB